MSFETNLFDKKRKLIDDFLRKNSVNKFYEIDKAIEYSLFTGGKRLRPVISLTLAEMFGLKPDDILPFAAAIEYLHTASLIHDDLPIMDDDDIRRGKPSVHKKFSDQTALLAADIMISEAMNFIIKYSYRDDVKNGLLGLLSDTWGMNGISGGQALEKEKEKIKEINPLHIFLKKTGILFGAAFLGPGIIGNLNSEMQKKLYFTGINMGIIFQINDDIEDMNDKSYNITNEIDIVVLTEYKNKMIKLIKDILIKEKWLNKELNTLLLNILKEE